MISPPEEHLEIIARHLPTVSNLITLSVADYNAECNGIRHKTSRKTRACIIHDSMVHRAKQLFDGADGVMLKVSRGLFLLIFDCKVCLRFKKLNKKKLSRNIPTQQTLSYMGQQELPEIPQTSKMIAGYQFNNLETDIAVYLTYPNGESPMPWHLLLAPSTENVAEMPTAEKEAQGKRGIKVKFIGDQEKEKEVKDEKGKS